ncbi:MAG: GNAT family N-acetyltransferase [Paracoccaceae bacterium]
MIAVGPADPRALGPAGLLAQSHALMDATFPAEANHYLDLNALCGPDIRFRAATSGGRTIGVGALALRDDYEELKSIFTAPEARGRGIGDALLRALIEAARVEGIGILRLETGDVLQPAHRLYVRHGFCPCGPFGDYEAGPHSVVMQRTLDPPARA